MPKLDVSAGDAVEGVVGVNVVEFFRKDVGRLLRYAIYNDSNDIDRVVENTLLDNQVLNSKPEPALYLGVPKYYSRRRWICNHSRSVGVDTHL